MYEQLTLDNFISNQDNALTDRQTDRQTARQTDRQPDRPLNRQLRVLELFSGFECMSNAFRERGHECFTIDWDERFPSSLHKDISTLTLDDLPEEFRHPDIVFCGIECRTYSVAAISHHRRKNPITGNLDPISEDAKFYDNMALHVKSLIRTMKPKIVIWENPVGALRKMDFMQEYIRNETTYCQWGFTYRKATDFFSNIDLKLKPPCKKGASCHESAPRGSKTGIQRITDPALKSVYPPELCKHIVRVCEEAISNMTNDEEYDVEDFPDDVNDFLMYYTFKYENEYVVPLNRVQEALEHYFYM